VKIGSLDIDEHGNVSMTDIDISPEELQRFEQIIAEITKLAEVSRRPVVAVPTVRPKCRWMGCQEPATHKIMSLPGGGALEINLCKKHVEELDKLLHPKQNTLPEAADYEEAAGYKK